MEKSFNINMNYPFSPHIRKLGKKTNKIPLKKDAEDKTFSMANDIDDRICDVYIAFLKVGTIICQIYVLCCRYKIYFSKSLVDK